MKEHLQITTRSSTPQITTRDQVTVRSVVIHRFTIDYIELVLIWL